MAKSNIVLRRDYHIGEPAAEDDDQFLSQCFVDIPVLEQVLDFDSPKSIILGRTGCGKSALIRNIVENNNNSVFIDPKEVSLEYIANTDILMFLSRLNFDLTVLFEIMWKHIILVKTVECYFENMSRFEAAFSNIMERKNPARKYYEDHRKDFWNETDVVMKEITNSFSDSIAGELSGALNIPPSELSAAIRKISEITRAQRVEIESRTKEAIGKAKLQALAKAIDGLGSLMPNKQKGYYLLIDDLDTDWASNELRYQIIFALISSIKPLRKIRNLKVIVAIRSDLYEKVIHEKKSETIQPEKYEGIVSEIRWNKNDLRRLLDLRINYLFRFKYNKQNVSYTDIFPSSVRRLGFLEFLLMRTQMRPRDLIAFINLMLDSAAGSTVISSKNVISSETEYSRKRFEALCREWMSMHPNLDIYLGLLRNRTGKTNITKFSGRDIIVNLCLELSEREDSDRSRDDINRACDLYSKRESSDRLFKVAQEVLSILYKVGAVEIKLHKEDVYLRSYVDTSTIESAQISEETDFKVTPMLWRILGITPNI